MAARHRTRYYIIQQIRRPGSVDSKGRSLPLGGRVRCKRRASSAIRWRVIRAALYANARRLIPSTWKGQIEAHSQGTR